MPDSALWSLIVALIMLALGLALKVAQLTHRLDDISKKSASAESEIKSFQDNRDEEISNIKQLHSTQTKELSDTISNLKLKLIETHSLLDEAKQKLVPPKDEWSPYIPMTAPDGFVYFKNTVSPGLFACAACKGMEPLPIILQPVRNAHTPGVYQCVNCKTWGVIT